jgi:predicted amidohydrolase YtcJ
MMRLPLYIGLLVLPMQVSAQAATPADLILHNGKIVTLDDANRVMSAIVIRDGTILAVGDESLVRAYRSTRTIDLRGRMVMPGFIDSHTHIWGYGKREIDLSKVRSIRELQDSVRAKVRLLEPGAWITGRAWAEDNFAERRLPTRADLDAATTNNPVQLIRAGGHSSVSNSVALRIAGIGRATPQPSAGMIEHDAAGEPTGVIRERDDLVGRHIPPLTAVERRPALVQALRDQLALGITSLIQAGAYSRDSTDDRPDWPEWERVYSSYRGQLPRASVQIYWRGVDDLVKFAKHPGDGDAWLRVGPLKLLVDGGFTGPSAYTKQPYKGMADFRGTLNLSPDSLYRVVQAAHALGWQMGLHAIGDSAIEITARVFDRVLRESPKADHRNYLNHFTVLPSDATLDMMARDSILVTTQPNFTYTLEERYSQLLEGERLARNNGMASPMRRGVFVAMSSDILPIGPMVGLYAAVSRKGKSGTVFGANEAISIVDALRAYTKNGAYLTREEQVKGTLEVGKYADLVVLSRDLLTIPPEQILDTQVMITVLAGKVVFERR